MKENNVYIFIEYTLHIIGCGRASPAPGAQRHCNTLEDLYNRTTSKQEHLEECTCSTIYRRIFLGFCFQGFGERRFQVLYFHRNRFRKRWTIDIYNTTIAKTCMKYLAEYFQGFVFRVLENVDSRFSIFIEIDLGKDGPQISITQLSQKHA